MIITRSFSSMLASKWCAYCTSVVAAPFLIYIVSWFSIYLHSGGKPSWSPSVLSSLLSIHILPSSNTFLFSPIRHDPSLPLRNRAPITHLLTSQPYNLRPLHRLPSRQHHLQNQAKSPLRPALRPVRHSYPRTGPCQKPQGNRQGCRCAD